jgi:hypothetical protein
MIPFVDAHVCDFVEPDGTTVGTCHLVGPHGGRCPACDLEARDCEHVLRTACAVLTCTVHESASP